jgi:hypothetical protein
MTPQEQDMISGLIDRVEKTQLAEKDMDAEQMLQQGLGRNGRLLNTHPHTGGGGGGFCGVLSKPRLGWLRER